MQISSQGTKAYHSENLEHALGMSIANNLHIDCSLTLVLGLDVWSFDCLGTHEVSSHLWAHAPISAEMGYLL